MKKILLTISVIFCVLTSFAQYQKSDLMLNQNLYKHYSNAEIEQMYQQDFARLFRLNFRMTNYALFAAKMPAVNSQNMGFLDKYAKPGIKVDEDEIIRTGQIDPEDFNLPQDKVLVNIFPLHRAGYYVYVLSKSDYDNYMETQLSQFAY